MARPAAHRTGNAAAATTLGILVVFVIVATGVAITSNNNQRKLLGEADSVATATDIEDRMVAYTEVLYGVRSQFAQAIPTRESYEALISGLDLDNRYEGVQVIGAAELVSRADLRAWEAESQAALDSSPVEYPDLAVYPDTVDNQKLPISYLNPVEGNEQALGLDFLSEPNRRSAANRARDSGGPAATAPVTLVQETGTQLAILMMVPFYEGNTTPESISERRASFQGVVYAAFRMGDLLNAVLGTTRSGLIEVVDVAAEAPLKEQNADNGSPRADNGTTSEQTLVVGGREWLVTVNSPAGTLSPLESAMPVIILFGGLAIAVLIAGLIRSTRNAQARAIDLAWEMTTELEAITEAANEAIVSVDVNGDIVAWNRGAAEMFGVSADGVLGTPISRFIPDSTREAFNAAHAEAMASPADDGDTKPTDLTVRRFDGSEFPIELSTSKWSVRGETFRTGFARDLTERVQAQAEIVEKLTALDRAKNDFVSTMSHELRTPLASIIGFTELLTDAFEESDDAANARLVGMVERNAERLLNLVEDILTLSQIESGSFKLRRETTDCETLLRSAADAVAPLAGQSGITIDLHIDGPLWVEADRPQMERVFLNLLSNAVKFSHDQSTVTVHAAVRDGEVVVSIEDTGIGIPLDEQDQLFNRFFRSRVAEQQSIAGTGLGLAIVHNIVERHDGTIGVTSVEAMGTTIVVSIPVATTSAPTTNQQEALA